jgi:hypothetical protein
VIRAASYRSQRMVANVSIVREPRSSHAETCLSRTNDFTYGSGKHSRCIWVLAQAMYTVVITYFLVPRMIPINKLIVLTMCKAALILPLHTSQPHSPYVTSSLHQTPSSSIAGLVIIVVIPPILPQPGSAIHLILVTTPQSAQLVQLVHLVHLVRLVHFVHLVLFVRLYKCTATYAVHLVQFVHFVQIVQRLHLP